eukprot:scaffold840_cov265-Pinguiococcus_pyrenoidosus.AAC.10
MERTPKPLQRQLATLHWPRKSPSAPPHGLVCCCVASAALPDEDSGAGVSFAPSDACSARCSLDSASAQELGEEAAAEMGCHSSVMKIQHLENQEGSTVSGQLEPGEAAEPGAGPLAAKTIMVRDAGTELLADYAYLSQRGYYPNELRKPNQDALAIESPFMEDENLHFFGVFDGHGLHGDACSRFVKTRLPEILEGRLRRERTAVLAMSPEHFEKVLSTAFAETNTALHRSAVDDMLSGTTAIVVIIRGISLTVCNVGDSRAIIGSYQTQEHFVKAFPLSVDHTPFRADEARRVKEAGAVIRTLGQVEGVEPIHEKWETLASHEQDYAGEDPPRVWDAKLEAPGCAFTRSFGDKVAEALGVMAEPEMSTRSIQCSDRYIVLASDGVFEFMTSQSVMDMVVKMRDPLKACHGVVNEAYHLWLQFEIRTDDITIICIHLRDLDTSISERSISKRVQADMDLSKHQRPVRRRFLSQTIPYVREKSLQDGLEEEHKGSPAETREEKQRLRSITSSNFLFSRLNEEQWTSLVNAFRKRTVKAGQLIIQQGDEGGTFYVVESGRYVALVAPPGEKPTSEKAQMVFEYRRAGEAFGELSLMYGKPRSASVRAVEDGTLWTLSRTAFQRILMAHVPRRRLIQTLRQVKLFRPLLYVQLQRLCDLLYEERYTDGQHIVRQGHRGNHFYIVEEGEVSCRVQENGSETEVYRVKKHGYFGERALMNDEPRVASCVACGSVKVLVVSRRAFMEIIGDLRQVLEQRLAEETAKSEMGDDAKLDPTKPPAQENGRFASQMIRNDTVVFAKRAQNDAATTTLRSREALRDFEGIWAGQNIALAVAIRTDLKKRVTLKVCAKHDLRAVRRLVKEHAILKSFTLSSPRIPRQDAHFADAHCAYLLYRDVAVCTFRQFLQIGPLDAEQIVLYAVTLILIVDFLHKEGVILRNLTCDDVVLLENGYPQIHNFGDAKRMDGSKCFTMCGNPSYWAPEVISREGYDHAWDLWSLGVFMYEMVMRTTPFEERRDDGALYEEKTFANILRHEEGDLAWDMSAPPEMRDVVEHLLHPIAGKRIGANGATEIRRHEMFRNISWQAYQTEAVDVHDFSVERVLREMNHLPKSRFEDVAANTDTPAEGVEELLLGF